MDREQAFKVCFITTCNSGVTYYRVVNFAKYMAKEPNVSIAYSKFDQKSQTVASWEVGLEFNNYAKQIGLNREKILDDIDMLMDVCDVAVWQITHTASSYALFTAYLDKYANKKPIITEVDDYVFAINPESLAFESYYPNSNPEWFGEMQIRNSNFIICSTNWLKEGDGIFNGLKKYNQNIECIPNSIDFGIWDKLKNDNGHKTIKIGWAGGQPHHFDLKIIHPVIETITNKYKTVEFVFFGYMPDYIKIGSQCKHFHRWYGIFDYPAALAAQGFDIGLAPLRDNIFNRAKSNLRWLEYSALKVPTIASPRVPFLENKNILFAEETEEWIALISDLIENKQKRINLGEAAYEEVKDKYDVKNTSLKYLNLLKAIVEGKRPITKMRYDERGNPFVIT